MNKTFYLLLYITGISWNKYICSIKYLPGLFDAAVTLVLCSGSVERDLVFDFVVGCTVVPLALLFGDFAERDPTPWPDVVLILVD